MSWLSGRTLRTFALAAFILLGMFLSWDYFKNPGRYHDYAVRAKVAPLQPSASMPTFRSVQTPLARGTRDTPNEAAGGGVPPK